VSAVRDQPEQQRLVRALMGLVAASALAYPMLLCAVELGLAQLVVVDVPAVVLWLAMAVTCSVALVAAVRWGAERPVRSPWLLTGLAPPALFELWVVWPLLTG
jgi:hypothetical protein